MKTLTVHVMTTRDIPIPDELVPVVEALNAAYDRNDGSMNDVPGQEPLMDIMAEFFSSESGRICLDDVMECSYEKGDPLPDHPYEIG